MKKVISIVASFMVLVCAASADVYTFTSNILQGATIAYSEAIPVSGWLDKIEFIQANLPGTTSTVTVATYSGTLAVEKYLNLSATTNPIVVVRPRVLGTDATGTALTPASAAWTNGSTIQLNGLYEKPMIGSNLKIAMTGTWNVGTNAMIFRIFYEPVKK